MNPDLTNIKNIIFDLGNVLLNLDFDASLKAFAKLGAKSEVLDDKNTYSYPIFYALEVGKATPDEFRNQIRKILNNNRAADWQIDDAWCAMIKDIPKKRVKVIQELKKKYNIYLFSNTNEIHIDRLFCDFYRQLGINFSSLFVKGYYSFEIHDRKPNLSSFLKVLEDSTVKPQETLFVDDLEANILSAQAVGLQTFWLKKGMEMADVFK